MSAFKERLDQAIEAAKAKVAEAQKKAQDLRAELEADENVTPGTPEMKSRFDAIREAGDAAEAAAKELAELKAQRVELSREVGVEGQTAKAIGDSVRVIGERERKAAKGDQRSLGDRLADHDGYKAALADGIDRGGASFKPVRLKGLVSGPELKAVLTGAPTFEDGVGPLIDSQRLETVWEDRRENRLLGRVTTRSVDSPLLHFAVQEPRTNEAAAVAEASTKPSADLEFVPKTENTVTIAVTTTLSRQALRDIGYLQGEVIDLMRRDLVEKTEDYLVSGTGVAPQPRGILNTSGVQIYNPAAAEDRLVTLQEALDKLEDVFASADTIALNHRDVSKFVLQRDQAGGTANTGQFLYANPLTGGLPQLLGVPLVKSPLVTAGSYIAGDFRSIKLAILEGATVAISEHHDQNFTENMVTLRVEYEAGIIIDRPHRLIRGQFNDSAAGDGGDGDGDGDGGGGGGSED